MQLAERWAHRTLLGSAIARRGLMAPGDAITSLGADGRPFTSGGTSAAVPFVTGTIALLLSMFPEAGIGEVKLAATRADLRRATVVPPLLDAWAAYELLQNRRAYG
jgi:subtilisin family serine protease